MPRDIEELLVHLETRGEEHRADAVALEAEYRQIGLRMNQKVDAVRRVYEKNDAVVDLVAQLRKSKALDWLLHHVELVDESGASIDRALVLGDDHDHDHDHDHEHGQEA